MKDAESLLDGNLPTDVVALVRFTASGQITERAAFDEGSLLTGR